MTGTITPRWERATGLVLSHALRSAVLTVFRSHHSPRPLFVGKTHERNDLSECGAAVPDGATCCGNFHALLLLESEIPGGPGIVAHFYAVATYGLQVRKACQVFHPRVGERVVVQVDQGQLLEAGQMLEFRSRLSLRLLRIQ
jgi:hypothetical protein